MNNTPTNLERKVMELTCEQLTNKEIADRLGLGLRTIEKYKENILIKFDLRNNVGIAMYAVQNGIYQF
jgi:DNA-binding CsgD family transcriptional regulator